MKNPIGFSLAVLATAGFALAGGEGEKKGGEKPADKSATNLLTSLQDGITYKAGKGIVYSSEAFEVAIKNQLQTQWAYTQNDPGQDTNNFNIRRARTNISGHAYGKAVKFKLQNEWNSNRSIKDAWIDWNLHSTDTYSMGVRFGQLKTQFGKEHRDSSSALQFLDRALATRTFTNARSRGAFLHGKSGMGNGNLMWSFGAQNTDMAAAAANSGEEGDPRGFDNADNELSWTLSVDFIGNGYAKGQGALDHSKNGFGAGAAYYMGNGRNAGNTDDVETSSATLWGGWRNQGIDVSAEYFMRSDDNQATGGTETDSSGFQIAVSYTMPKNGDAPQYGFGLRYSMIDLDANQNLLTGSVLGTNTADAEASEIELGVSRYSSDHNHKLQASVQLQEIDNATATATVDVTRLTVQHTIIF
jgi:hypothetical protein